MMLREAYNFLLKSMKLFSIHHFFEGEKVTSTKSKNLLFLCHFNKEKSFRLNFVTIYSDSTEGKR